MAELCGVETKRLKEQVRRNIERFPEDFMFELTKDELGLRIPPFVFTEHGILMLSSEKPKNKIGYTVKEKQKTYGKKS